MASDAWQPIETAPRDGTEFQARSILKGCVDHDTRARFNPDTGEYEVWVDYDHIGWCEINGRPLDWQPLPAPPKDAADA